MTLDWGSPVYAREYDPAIYFELYEPRLISLGGDRVLALWMELDDTTGFNTTKYYAVVLDGGPEPGAITMGTPQLWWTSTEWLPNYQGIHTARLGATAQEEFIGVAVNEYGSTGATRDVLAILSYNFATGTVTLTDQNIEEIPSGSGSKEETLLVQGDPASGLLFRSNGTTAKVRQASATVAGAWYFYPEATAPMTWLTGMWGGASGGWLSQASSPNPVAMIAGGGSAPMFGTAQATTGNWVHSNDRTFTNAYPTQIGNTQVWVVVTNNGTDYGEFSLVKAQRNGGNVEILQELTPLYRGGTNGYSSSRNRWLPVTVDDAGVASVLVRTNGVPQIMYDPFEVLGPVQYSPELPIESPQWAPFSQARNGPTDHAIQHTANGLLVAVSTPIWPTTDPGAYSKSIAFTWVSLAEPPPEIVTGPKGSRRAFL